VSSKLVLPPQRSLGNQVRRCHRMFDRMLSARLSRHHLNSGFWYYLRALWIQDGRTQKELSDITNVRENTTVGMINLMIKEGFVERARDPVDRRKLRITLTPRGRKLEAELMHYAIEINAIAAAGIHRAEIETCLSVLARAAENLQHALDHVPESAAARNSATRRMRRRSAAFKE
jgi:MarR family transcriptional regulator, organic hydroperoxide resistance regulator